MNNKQKGMSNGIITYKTSGIDFEETFCSSHSKPHEAYAKAYERRKIILCGTYAGNEESGEIMAVNAAGNYTKPKLRKSLFNKVKREAKGGASGQWSARKAQRLALLYKKAGGGYTS